MEHLPFPERGFYRHYKHDPQKEPDNYTYEVMGVGEHTEQRDLLFVIYRPLGTDSPAYQKGKLFYMRPLEMFMGEVTKDGKTFPRFTKVTDPPTIERLIAKREEL